MSSHNDTPKNEAEGLAHHLAALALLVTTDLKVLAALDGSHSGRFAGTALETKHNFLGGLRL